jgi:hypothetical protein
MREHQEPPRCTCGCKWEDHHHSYIMNSEVPSEAHDYGICRGCAAQECESTQVNGEWLVPENKRCYCPKYVNSKTGKSLGDWRKDNKKD